MRSQARRVAAVALSVVLASVLVGCEPVGVDPIAARVLDGELEFLFCEGISSREILIETREGGGDWHAVVDKRMVADIRDGQVLSLSQIDDSQASEGFSIAPGGELAIVVSGADTAQVASYVWPDRVPDDEWVTAGRNVTSHPCSNR